MPTANVTPNTPSRYLSHVISIIPSLYKRGEVFTLVLVAVALPDDWAIAIHLALIISGCGKRWGRSTCTFILSLMRPDGASSGNHSAAGTASGCMNLTGNRKGEYAASLCFKESGPTSTTGERKIVQGVVSCFY